MAQEREHTARDRAPASEFGVDGDVIRRAVDCGQPATIETEIV